MKPIRSKWGLNMTRKSFLLTMLGLVVTALSVPTITNAQSNDFAAHYNRYLFFDSGLATRSAGMGGAYSALRGGEMGFLGNPASMGFVENQYMIIKGGLDEVSSNASRDYYGSGPATTNNEVDIWDVGGGYAYPFQWGAIGAYYNYREDEIDQASYNFANRTASETSDLERHLVSLTGAYRANEFMSVGYRYSYHDWDSDTKANEIAPNPGPLFNYSEDFSGHKNHIGLQYGLNEMLFFGLDGYYGIADWDVSGGGDGDADDWGIRGGAAWHLATEMPITLALDLKWESRDGDFSPGDTDEDLWGVHLGGEIEVTEEYALRLGYRFESFDYEEDLGYDSNPDVSGYTAGIGYKYENYVIDYGLIYTDTGDSDLMHVFGLTYEF